MNHPMSWRVSEALQGCIGSQCTEFTRHAVRGDRQRAPQCVAVQCSSPVLELSSELA